MLDIRNEIMTIYELRATCRYGLSTVNQQQQALQCAALAEKQGETAAMIVAAQAHDIGQMVHELGEEPANGGIDDLHDELGARWLANHFGPDVVEPVRLHVPAKRFLCATDPSYFGKLSPDSVRSSNVGQRPLRPRHRRRPRNLHLTSQFFSVKDAQRHRVLSWQSMTTTLS
jgi:[1-hydroxy-2-(trimethylamino)ethyl]phosphonate dioxygenase